MKVRTKTQALVLVLTMLLSCVGIIGQELPISTIATKDYTIKGVIITGEGGIKSQQIQDHYDQSMVVGLEMTTLTVDAFLASEAQAFDFIYLDEGLEEEEAFDALVEQTMAHVASGSTIYLSCDYVVAYPLAFIGIKQVQPLTTRALDFKYPQVNEDLKALQTVWKNFATTYKKFKGLHPEHHIDFKYGVITDGAKAIIEQNSIAYMTANTFGEGKVLWSNGFMPSYKFITGFDLIPEEGQKYFHFGYATANYTFRNELAKYVAKNKYGIALTKMYGPYGRPGLAWQNHYEELQSIKKEEAIKFAKILEGYNQIPTYSLIRSSYNWGRWYSTLAVHTNIGTNQAPHFQGQLEDSFYSSGKRVETTKDYINRGMYPGYFTLLSKIELPDRAAPAVLDVNGDGKKDLLVGAADGKLMYYKNIGTNNKPVFEEGDYLKDAKGNVINVGANAAPHSVDYNGDGHLDLVIGNKEGYIILYLNNKKNGFVPGGKLYKQIGQAVQGSGTVVPHMVDWDKDGVLDLILGDESGKVKWLKGHKKGSKLVFANEVALASSEGMIEVGAHSAPCVVDWNEDGEEDLLVGANDGQIYIFLSQEGVLIPSGKVEGEELNFFGNYGINVGHNAMPVVVDWDGDGKKDLLTGQVEYGSPYNIDSPLFPHKKQLENIVKYCQENFIPLIPHMYFHQYRSEAFEKVEIELHKKALEQLGIDWSSGVNQHTWRVSDEDARTFINQQESGIWWNFGFQPPRVGSAPRDGVEFLWVMPFYVSNNKKDSPFVLFAPAPNILNYRSIWEDLAYLDMPLTYFEHIENSLIPGTNVNTRLMSKVNALNEFRQANNYTFMTENQMAESMVNAMFTKVNVELKDNQWVLTQDTSKVPKEAGIYKGTLGVKVELGEQNKGKKVNTTSLYAYRKTADNHLYTGVEGKGITLNLDTQDTLNERLHITSSNTPITYEHNEKQMTIHAHAQGMQEVNIYSKEPLTIKGKGVKVTRKGNNYQIIHYGDRVTITVKKNK